MQKQSWLYLSDGSNIRWSKIINLYGGFKRLDTLPGYFIKATVKTIAPPRIEYKGFKVKVNKKGDIIRCLLIRYKKLTSSKDGFFFKFKSNHSLLIKKKQNIKSKYIYGPINSSYKRKKVLILFKSFI